ncbi:MAG: MATE family efflux transporter [Ruminococcus sp.]|nr:MATE family efflux transporter [Ruminococcus sp.]
MLTSFRKKYIGDRRFYRGVLAMVVPMILQNLVTNFVSLIDNIMVGQTGTEPMSGVSIVNQLIFVFNISLFGAVSGPGIFGAQFYGKGDAEGQRYTFRFRLGICAAIVAVGLAVLGFFDRELISLFLSKDDQPEKVAATLDYGLRYMRIMLIGLIPFGLGQAYSSLVRECGHTSVPMIGSMCAVAVNLLLDYGLIFGRLGMPKLGVEGAAAATVIAKYIEAGVVILWSHLNTGKIRCVRGAYRSPYVPRELAAAMVKKGLPLFINEFLWAAGMSVIAQFYSARGLDVVAARNISLTMTNLFGAVYIQLGACIAILVGARLGANKLKEARDLDNKLLFFAVAVSAILAVCMIPLAPAFPELYRTEDEVKALAAYMILIQALVLPLWSYTNACYFTLRSGGKTGLTFLFDFGTTWLIYIPLAYVLSYHTKLDIHIVFAIVNFAELLKVVLGYFMVRSDIWINNIVGGDTPETE